MIEAPNKNVSKIRSEPFWGALLRGYGNLGRGGAVLVVSAIAIASAGAIIVYPLWLVATRSPQAYTTAVLVLGAAAVCILLGRWFLRMGRVADDGFRTPLRRIALAVGRLLSVALLALGLYVDILVFQVGRVVPGVLLAVGLLVVVGFLFSGFGRRGDRGRHVA